MRHLETAPAKLNLSLRVLGKRDDGFHEIETLMVPLAGIADELRFDLSVGDGGVTLCCDDRALPTGADNLVMRAVAAFEAETGVRFEGGIELRKHIPSGAGLGGGSSDAAATLRALDAVAGTGLGAARLGEIAARIGSDVPFFITAQPALCRGRGERIEVLAAPLPRLGVVLAKPGFGVPSAWAYSRWAASEPLPGVDYAPQPAPWGEAVNDLERPVFGKYLVLPALKAWLGERPETGVALMSGSGSTLFATLREGEGGEALIASLRGEFGEETWAAEAAIGGTTAGE